MMNLFIMLILAIIILVILLVVLFVVILNCIATVKSKKKSSDDAEYKSQLRQAVRRNIRMSYPESYEKVTMPVRYDIFDYDPISYERVNTGQSIHMDIDTGLYKVTDHSDPAYGTCFKSIEGYQENLWSAVRDKNYDSLY